MKSKLVFSIVIPSLNEEKRLPIILEDLYQQSLKNFEVIVVDGHSDDKSARIVKSFGKKMPKVRLVSSSKRNVCVQRNLGAKQAKADTIIFADADDRIPPYFLQGVKYKLESDPADLATFWIESNEKDRLTPLFAAVVNHFLELAVESPKPLLLEGLIVVRKDYFTQVGGFNENIPFSEGDALAKSFLEHGFTYKIYREPKYIFCFRRLHKYGILKMNTRVIALQLMKILSLQLAYDQALRLYPMEGGAALEVEKKKNQKKKKILREIDKILSKISINNQRLTIQTIKDSFRTLFSE